MRIKIPALLIAVSLLLFRFVPPAQAVNPPPDGGYPGFNTAEGTNALFSLTTGVANAGIGWYSLYANTDGSWNTGLGGGALALNDGDFNTGVGAAALLLNITGVENTALGTAALALNETGFKNTAVGTYALYSNTGSYNTAIGYGALDDNTTGASNTAVGYFTLHNSTGNSNIALGDSAGINLTGSGNVCIGTGSNAVVDNTTWIRNVNTLTQNFSAGINNYVTVRLTDGRLGNTAVVSSRRYKEEIKPLATTSEALYSLEPVSFRLKKQYDETNALGFGLIAEEVEKVNPDLVYRNTNGQVESVRYEMVNAMLLNEFLKEHRKGEEQDSKIEKLESSVARLESLVNRQAAQLQKVSTQLDLNKAGSRTVAIED